MSTENRTRLLLVLSACLLASAGCRQNMHNQNKVNTLGASPFFEDGQGARPIPANTVARGDLREGSAYTGLDASQRPVSQVPFPVTREVLLRGQERYNVFCSPCHDRTGSGNGMIVRRGYKQPTSFHDPRLRGSQVGYFFNVMTEGFGVMPSYAPQVPVADRWAIAAYIRALQYSQNARMSDLAQAGVTPERLRQIETELAEEQPAGPGKESHGSPSTAQGVARPGPRGSYDQRPDPSEVPEQ
ncbi:MAG TPA: cytochrome c [Thermoanaerobaculia bacterium]|nr:cytochrome c [Thermoanaerobaculia bacterium]